MRAEEDSIRVSEGPCWFYSCFFSSVAGEEAAPSASARSLVCSWMPLDLISSPKGWSLLSLQRAGVARPVLFFCEMEANANAAWVHQQNMRTLGSVTRASGKSHLLSEAGTSSALRHGQRRPDPPTDTARALYGFLVLAPPAGSDAATDGVRSRATSRGRRGRLHARSSQPARAGSRSGPRLSHPTRLPASL